MRPLIFALIAIGLFATSSEAGCDESNLTERQHYFINVVVKESGSKPSWFNHKLSKHPIFVFDNRSARTCAAFWNPGKGWSYIETSNGYKTSSPYEYVEIYDPKFRQIGYGDEKNSPIRTELQSVLQSNGLTHAMIWTFGTWQPDLTDPKTREFAEKSPEQNASALGVAIHEAMHMFLQREPSATWTKFGSTRLRDEDLQACYVGTVALKQIHEKEIAALMNAFTATTGANTRKYAAQYLSLRAQRYTLQPSVKYKDWNGVEHVGDCKENEARQELGEGVPQFTGNAMMLDLKLATRRQIADEILLTTNYYLTTTLSANERPIQSYYHTGSVTLLLIRQFYKGDFLKLTETISQPDAKVVLTDLLKQVLAGE